MDDSVIAVGGWLDHCVGLGRPAYQHEINPSVAGPQHHLSDECHRKTYILRMYVL